MPSKRETPIGRLRIESYGRRNLCDFTYGRLKSRLFIYSADTPIHSDDGDPEQIRKRRETSFSIELRVTVRRSQRLVAILWSFVGVARSKSIGFAVIRESTADRRLSARVKTRGIPKTIEEFLANPVRGFRIQTRLIGIPC